MSTAQPTLPSAIVDAMVTLEKKFPQELIDMMAKAAIESAVIKLSIVSNISYNMPTGARLANLKVDGLAVPAIYTSFRDLSLATIFANLKIVVDLRGIEDPIIGHAKDLINEWVQDTEGLAQLVQRVTFMVDIYSQDKHDRRLVGQLSNIIRDIKSILSPSAVFTIDVSAMYRPGTAHQLNVTFKDNLRIADIRPAVLGFGYDKDDSRAMKHRQVVIDDLVLFMRRTGVTNVMS